MSKGPGIFAVSSRAIFYPIIAAVLAGVGFTIRYVNDPIVPHAARDGWHMWLDQSEYMRSALAFSSLSLASSEHRYPPLYALLAAPFTRLLPNDPFLVVDLISICTCAYLLTILFRRDCGPVVAAVLGVLLLVGNRLIAEAFIVPWTSTPAMPLVLASLVMLRWADDAPSIPMRASAALGALIGLIFLARPFDGFVIGMALAPFWGLRIYRQYGFSFRHAAAFAAAALMGPLTALGANLAIHHQPFSPYMIAHTKRFVVSAIPERLVSLFLDSGPLYLEQGQTIFSKFPWMVIALPALAVCFILGRNGLRAAVLAIMLFVAAYAAFDDLVPNGLFRYNNYHYLRWLLVVAPMFVLPAVGLLVRASPTMRLWASSAALLCFLPAFVVIKTTDAPVPIVASGQFLTIKAGGSSFDYVDISPVSGAWEDVYSSDPRAAIDGRPIRHDHIDVRMLPAAPGIRVLFIQHETGENISLNPPEKINIDPRGLVAKLGTYHFGFGFPGWLK